ncbi:hypothetical protein Aph01nite_04920 [Acrocarpospora phusangensis]|uniref:Enoyl-CoA hydratase n=1 Tax=Acrocarpospora phusangensis TaxID=1070424 RepID=A0A919Q996_9ACTN|nr:enoyl-CoA hydratase/isomerase family protein [Acrocarpospora phusangensis]GIH22182.1 hypothetical protein Aph01nite_04920 [Acrocarpospora phusangensis]
MAVEIDRRGSALWITLNRPERHNMYDVDMADAMLTALYGTAGAQAVVITGKGGVFCAGSAFDQLEEAPPAPPRELLATSARLVEAIRGCPQPVLAAVDGLVAGGGNELVVACDFALATRRSSFGRMRSARACGLLAAQVGERRAKEMAMLGRRYSAQQALEMGLINEVVPDGELGVAVGRWLTEIHGLSPRLLETAKSEFHAERATL